MSVTTGQRLQEREARYLGEAYMRIVLQPRLSLQKYYSNPAAKRLPQIIFEIGMRTDTLNRVGDLMYY